MRWDYSGAVGDPHLHSGPPPPAASALQVTNPNHSLARRPCFSGKARNLGRGWIKSLGFQCLWPGAAPPISALGGECAGSLGGGVGGRGVHTHGQGQDKVSRLTRLAGVRLRPVALPPGQPAESRLAPS